MRLFLRNHLDDVLVVSGAGLMVYATWLLSAVAAIYAAGVVLIVFGILIGLGGARAAGKGE